MAEICLKSKILCQIEIGERNISQDKTQTPLKYMYKK